MSDSGRRITLTQEYPMAYHESLRPVWLRRAVRSLLTASYCCLLLAGVASTITPPASIRDSTSGVVTVLWGVWLIAGAATAAFGAATRRPGLEFLGILPLASAWGVYGVVLLVRQWSIPGLASSGTVVAWGLLGLTTVFLYRFGVLLAVARRWERISA
jgi:hypothetical protein